MKRILVTSLIVVGLNGCRPQESNPTPAPGGPASTGAAPVTPVAPAASVAPTAPGASVAPVASVAATTARVWTFDADKAGEAPAGFAFGRTGVGREGKWVVRAEASAPSAPNVLAQTDADTTDDRFPVAFATEPVLKDGELAVRCKPISGKVDQACGLVFRLRDANNYYLTRANALEDNVRLYYVKDGHRQQIATYSGKVTSGVWHELRAVAHGDHFEVYWDGKKVLEQEDKTFPNAGKVGVWTKADTVTYFDDLRVRPL
jgi:hypothetical protein